MCPHKAHYQHIVTLTHKLAKTFGRLMVSCLLNSTYSMPKAIKHFIYILDTLWVKVKDIFNRLDIVSLFTNGSIKKVLYFQNNNSEKGFSPRSWYPHVSVTPPSFMNTQPMSLFLPDISRRNLTKKHSTT